MAALDGVIQYQGVRRVGSLTWTPAWDTLNTARTQLFDCGLVGAYPDGVGYGNLSVRTAGGCFVVTGSGTGAQRVLRPDQYCLVERYSLADNRVWAMGCVDASSESMTHGALYDARPEIGCVMHVHSRGMFDHLLRQHAPATSPDIPYGTPAMAYAVQKLAQAQNKLPALFVMAGHDEGLVAFGVDVHTTLAHLLGVFQEISEGT